MTIFCVVNLLMIMYYKTQVHSKIIFVFSFEFTQQPKDVLPWLRCSFDSLFVKARHWNLKPTIMCINWSTKKLGFIPSFQLVIISIQGRKYYPF